jgi:hypothetical protein
MNSLRRGRKFDNEPDLKNDISMNATVSAPVEWIESIGGLRLPESSDQRLQELMDKNTEGALSEAERRELMSFVDPSQRLSLIRAEALHLLGRKPPDGC